MHTGEILAVCTSPRGNVPKYPQLSARLTEFGLEDDYHCRAERESHSRPGVMKSNADRQITVVALEAIQFANRELALNLKPGDFAENICTLGLGDLSQVTEGSRLYIDGSSVILKVVGQNPPCSNLSVYHRMLPKVIYGRRGLLCTIERGAGVWLYQGLLISIRTPDEIVSPAAD